jgi:hypothetical protein
LALAICLISFGFASTAFADSEPGQEQAAQYEKMLAQEAQGPGAAAASQDIEQVREWLSNAKVLLAKGDDEAAAVLLRRVGFGLDLIAALTKVGAIQQAADDQEAAYYTAKNELIPELRAEVQKLNDRKNELEAELRMLR